MGLTSSMKFMLEIRGVSKGAVSIFVVVFAILLMSVVTVSFMRIMINDQNQASSNDLAQSAYDSAQAGVEDAKRALVWYAQQCANNPSSCTALAAQLSTSQCNQALVNVAQVVPTADVSATEGGAGIGEIKVQQAAADESGESPDAALNQAYTCVTMQLNTEDYVGTASVNQPMLVPLASTEPFRAITIEWFSHDDLTNINSAVNVQSASGVQPLLSQASWPANRPPVLRAQYMQVGNSFSLSDFDFYRSAATPSDSESNTNTLFLYPTNNGNTTAELTVRDIRKDQDGNSFPASSSSAPYPVRCETSISGGGYSCRLEISLPRPMGGGDTETAYLLLSPFYASTHFRVSLAASSGTPVLFRGVQPMVDSTGRASDVFRRVQSRIDLYPTNPFIQAAVDTDGNLCKDFGVTDTQYIAGSCTP